MKPEDAVPPNAGLPIPPAGPRIEAVISGLLRWGVWTSFLLIAAGSVSMFVRDARHGSDAGELSGLIGAAGEFPRDRNGMVGALRAGRGTALVATGLLLLIMTPVLRVVISTVAFWRQRDEVFVLVTLGVLTLLLSSFVIGSRAPRRSGTSVAPPERVQVP